MKCPVCGAAELRHDTRDVPFSYKGETTLIPAVTGDFCPACAECVMDTIESQRFGEHEATALFGGGINAFSRYETGKTKPPLALVKLLRLLDRHPDLLNEIKTV